MIERLLSAERQLGVVVAVVVRVSHAHGEGHLCVLGILLPVGLHSLEEPADNALHLLGLQHVLHKDCDGGATVTADGQVGVEVHDHSRHLLDEVVAFDEADVLVDLTHIVDVENHEGAVGGLYQLPDKLLSFFLGV